MGRIGWPLVVAVCLGLIGALAWGESVRTVRTTRDGDWLTVAFSVSDLLSDLAPEEIESGLPTRIALRIALRREDSSEAVRASIRTCEVIYDLWDEVFHVHLEDERQSRWYDATSRNDAVRLCTSVRDTRLNVRGVEGGRYVIGVIAELNPVSTQMLEGLRAWLRVPTGAGGEGQSFFGSFVAIFINRRLGEADRTIRFRSEPFDL
ncbi:MAG: DUF4390 domain-containing protein [Myxococcales bacterium]|nr:DUF4390 domain-containing protein [Myxococcales bacterium]